MQIRDIGGLEHFKNLEQLDLSFHAVSDISPLAGLNIIEQIQKQLNKLIDVIKVVDISEQSVTSEMAFFKVKASAAVRNEIVVISSVYNARIIDMSPTTITLEVTGDESRLIDIRNMLEPYTILEMVQTGALSIEKGGKALKV